VNPLAFFSSWSGDAVIHLRIAEMTLSGYPLQFDAGGPVATTSVLWTGILTALLCAGGHTMMVWGCKAICGLSWLGMVVLSGFRYGRVTALLFALCPGALQNSWNGMEAALFGCLVLIWLETRSEAIGCAMVLCRPEGVLVWLVTQPKSLGCLAGAVCYIGANLAVGGSLLPISGMARTMAAAREAWITWPVMVHPRLLVRLALYLPLTVGCILGCRRDRPEGRILVAVALLYTFGTGAAHLARYCVPWMPLYCGMACRAVRGKPWVTLCLALFLTGGWAYEAHLRLAQGVGYPHAEIVQAHARRREATDWMLRYLGRDRATVAMTEVQSRYFWDERIQILGLDGRTGGPILRYIGRDGMRDVRGFLRDHPVDWFEPGQLLKGERP